MALPSPTRPILVGLALDPLEHDLTPAARAALVRGMLLARHTGARLDLLHAVTGDVFLGDGAESPGEEGRGGAKQLSYHLSRRGREALIEARRSACTDGVTAELFFRPERPVDALVSHAVRAETALVFVGRADSDSHGVGCVTRRLVERSPCPVWVADREEPVTIDRMWVRIQEERPVRLARSLARMLDAEIVDRGPAPLEFRRTLDLGSNHGSCLVPSAIAQ